MFALKRKFAPALVKALVGGVFLYSGAQKLVYPNAGGTMYAAFVRRWGAMHGAPAALEIFLGAWLISGFLPKHAACLAVLVLCLFCGALTAETLKRAPAPCGCMGTPASLGPSVVRISLVESLGRDVLLLAAAGYLFGTSVPMTRQKPDDGTGSQMTGRVQFTDIGSRG